MRKNIKEYKILTPNGYKSFKGIQKLYRDSCDIYFKSGKVFKCSLQHQLCVDLAEFKFKPASELEVGDTVVSTYKIEEVEKIVNIGQSELYDIVGVEDIGCYYSDGLLSHNCNFLNAGTSSLSEDLYDNMREQIKEPVETLMDGKYKLYEYPNPERLYGAGVDVSEGVGGDYSVLKMYDFTDLNEIIEVAEFHDNQTPVSEFANIVYEILGHWGRPPVCVERNNQGGQVADRLGKDLGYDKVVCWGGKLAGRKNLELFGMISSRNTKIQACANARYFYSDKQALVIRDEDSLEELFKHFVKQNNDSWAAVSGKHDDRTMAMIWAMMLLHSDVCEDYFTIEEVDTCGKISKIGPLEFGETFQNATSIYTNEQVDKIEHSQLAPVGFNMFGASDISEINQLMADGWQFAGGSAPYDDPDKNISQDMWSTIDKYFG